MRPSVGPFIIGRMSVFVKKLDKEQNSVNIKADRASPKRGRKFKMKVESKNKLIHQQCHVKCIYRRYVQIFREKKQSQVYIKVKKCR